MSEIYKPREPFCMATFLDKLLNKCDDLNNFPLPIRSEACERVNHQIHKINQAAELAKQGDPTEFDKIRTQFAIALAHLEDLGE